MIQLNPEEQRVLDELFEEARTGMLPKMKSSAFVMVALTGEMDLALALQVGVVILLEKPLLLLVMKNAWAPQRLRALADAVVSIDDMETPEACEKVKQGLETMIVKLRKKSV